MVTEPTTVDVHAALVRARRLQLLTEALAEALSPQEVIDAVISTGLGLDAAGARRGLIALLDEETRHLELAAWHGYREETMRAWRRFPLDDDLPLGRAVLRREPVYLRSQAERDRLFPSLQGRSEDGHALACLPLIAEGRALGGIVLSFAEDEDFDDERRAFKATLARLVAQALERTRLLEQQRHLRERLSLLAAAGELLSSSLGYEQTLAHVARISVPELADWCAVDMVGEGQRELVRLAVWSSGSEPMPEPDASLAEALATQRPALADDRTAVVLPLVARGRPLGALTLVRAEPGGYGDDEVELATELARRAAVAVDNALLFRETQRLADAARALEHVAQAVVLLDDHGVVRFWNESATRLIGLPEEGVIGRPAAEAIPGWGELAEQLAASTGDASRALVVALPTPQGERWCSLVAVRFASGSVYTLRDVTADHELERIRSDFVATASHELRTPLSAIYGAIRTLRHTSAEMTETQREVFLEMIELESERLRLITSQLLVAGQLDADSLVVRTAPVELDPVVREVLASAEIGKRHAVRFVYTPPAEPVTVLGEEELVRQVLANVVDNAVKYSPAGGDVEVEVSRVGRRVRVTVADQGIGVPYDVQDRIFEKFFRADPSMTLGVGGSGLGLYIARALLRKLDGDVAVSSTPGEGSTFTLDLPLA